MKSNYMNYFKEGQCYQWDKYNDIFTITPTNIDKSLEFCLEQKAMDMFLKFTNPQLQLGKTLLVKENNVKVNLQICEAVLNIPNMSNATAFKVNASVLTIAREFVNPDGNKPVLTGVYVGNNSIQATDSFTAYLKDNDNDATIIISSQFIKAISKCEGDIELSCNKNCVQAIVGGTTIIGRLIDGKYPNISPIYEKNKIGASKLILDTEEIKNYLSFSSNPDRDLVVFSNNKFTIEGAMPFEAELVDFNINCSISFTVKNFNKILKLINTEKIEFVYSDDKKPVFLNETFLLLPTVRL